MNTMRYLCSLFGASTDDLVTAETPAGWITHYKTFPPKHSENAKKPEIKEESLLHPLLQLPRQD